MSKNFQMENNAGDHKSAILFILTGLCALSLGTLFGIFGALQFVFPQLFKSTIPFSVIRPMHVMLVISWILFGAIGGIYYYLKPVRYPRLPFVHYILFTATGVILLFCYLTQTFGGREYFEYPPIFSAPIFLGWVLFALNVIPCIWRSRSPRPVYFWMWGTAAVLVLIVLIEAHLWILPYFGDNPIRDIAVQWKSYGSFIGCWNLMVYGTATYLMCRISEDDTPALSTKTFSLFFVGLANTLFNWGHHTYVVPMSPSIKHIAYFVSMAELVILASIIQAWLSKLSATKKQSYSLTYRFLVAAEAWVIVNLVLAILISIPAVNIYTHGTHITVAHSMGTTIGINSMILFASVLFIASRETTLSQERVNDPIVHGFRILNFSLACFWLCLLGAGLRRVFSTAEESFGSVTEAIRPFFLALGFAGVGIFLGFMLIIVPIFYAFYSSRKK